MPKLTTRIRYSIARALLKASSFSIVPSWVSTSVLNPGFTSLTRDGYQKSSAYFACVSAYAFAFPEPPLLVYDGDDDSAQSLPKHPLRQLLRQPMPTMGEAELMATTIAYAAIGGNAYWHKVRGKAGQIVQLRPYHAGQITPVPGGDNWIQRYDYDPFGSGGRAAQPTPIDPADIVHFKWPSVDPAQPWMSQPPILAAAAEVDSDVEAIRYIFALLHNDAIPRTVVTVPSDRPLDDDEYRRLKEQWRERYGGENRGDVAVLEGGATVSRLGLNLQELAFDALSKIPESRIAAAMRVPAIIAGLQVGLSQSTYANYEEARKSYTQDSLAPLWRLFASEVTADLLPEFQRFGGVEARFDTKRVAALQEDRAQRYAYTTEAYTAGLLTKNEARAQLGFDDVAGGDLFAAQQSTGQRVAQLIDSQSPKAMLLLADGTLVELPSGAARIVEQRAARIPQEQPGQTEVDETKASADDVERQIERAMTSYLRAQYRKAAAGVRNLAKADVLDPDAVLEQLELDLGPEARRIMRRYYVPLLRAAYDEAAATLDVDLDPFDVENKHVQDVLDELATLVTRVTETTRDSIRALVGQQAAEGWSIDQLAKHIVAEGLVESRKRAKLIAVTETALAYSKGSILGYQLSGIVDRIEWLTTIDEKTCEHCKALNGEQTKLGSAFSDGSAHPPRHPRCRCAIAPIIK